MTPPPPIDLLHSGPLRVHLIGVAGSGMSGIAGLLLALGHRVSGSDRTDSGEVARLKTAGLVFHTPHRAELVHDVDLVIYSSAIKPGNPAFDEAQRLAKPMIRRADALAALLKGKKGIVIAGMHGKTTTSAMAAHVLRAGGLKPSHYVGAEIPILGTNAHWEPDGAPFVIEGDESDGTLVLYHPEQSLILNIEAEHLDYYKDIAAIEVVFQSLLNHTSGRIFYCRDDAIATRLCESRRDSISYGSNPGADYHSEALVMENFQSHFDVYQRGKKLGAAVLNVPGAHNVCNAVGVVALASELGLPFPCIATALESFRGARRRFEFKFRGREFTVVDDYAHHPSELKATLATARAGHRGRIIALFQPHRYTRTLALQEDFGGAFGDADLVVISDIYAASERPIEGVSGQLLVEALKRHGHPEAIFEPMVRRMPARIGPRLQPGDMVLSLGAGNIHEASRQLSADLAHLEALRALAGTAASITLSEPLARHTTLRVGGPARFWCEPSTVGAFAKLLRYAKEHTLPVFVIGRGSNLLVRDGGLDGLVIHPEGGEFATLSVAAATHEITAGAGVKFKQVATAAAKANIAGFEWMEGIPGEVGGSLRMNAGAMGTETFDQVVSVRYLDPDGQLHEAVPHDLEVHYRDVASLKTNYAVSAVFRGRAGDPAEITRLLEESMRKRKMTQPIASSAGCIFKNPSKEIPAGKLIQELALKDARVGAARVSEVHGNFIVNDGGASAHDVLELISQIQAKARHDRGIELQTEVQIVGSDGT